MGNLVQFLAGPTVFNYWIDPNKNTGKILPVLQVIGLDSADVYSTKRMLAEKWDLVINNLKQRPATHEGYLLENGISIRIME